MEDNKGQNPEIDFTQKIKELEERLTQSETQKKEYLEGWQRAKADYINFKNEEGKRMEDMARFVISGFVEDILPVLDSFDLALSSPGLAHEIEKGILLIRSQFEDILKKRGVETIKVVTGDQFDPAKHEGIGEVVSNLPEGTVAEEVQRGYTLRGKVLRPSRVRLAKKES